MDLSSTGPSLNFMSTSSSKSFVANLKVDLNNKSKINEPKYSFNNKSISLTRSGRNLTSASVNCTTLVAIIEGKGNNRGQIGMATMDVRFSELVLCQFVDTNSYTLLRIRLSVCEVAEVILPEENEKSSARMILLDMLRNTCPRANITTLQRRYFNDSLGIDLVTKLNVEECSNVDASVFKKYFCMGAAAALIKYVEYIQNILYAHNSLKITYEAVEDSCLIDVNSWASLDLFHPETASNNGTPNSLFEILNCCLTRGGTRTLRTYLLQPSASVEIINSRLDIVQELVKNQAMCDRIRSVLSKLLDLQNLFSLYTYTNVEQSANREESKRVIRNKIIQLVELKRLLDAIKKISEVISHSNSPFFLQNKKRLDDCRLEAIAEFVDDKISSELTTRKRKGLVASSSKDQILFAVAESQHVLLDVARRTYQELVARIVEFGTVEQKDIPGAQLCYSQSRGYHFSLHANDPYSINLPSHCIQVVFNKASLTFTTRELIKYNDRLLQSENEILHKSNLVLDQLIGSIREYIPALYKCAELVSLFDYYTALACYCSKVQTVRPSFGKELLIVHGRHPLLDYRKDVVPNDARASHTESRFAIIAGPNMAGKSTYMRQVCMLQILAQMGCMVPAEKASFVLMTRIFSRVGHNDALVQNLSGILNAFVLHMSEMAVILQNANETSLIIIDELARSTSTEEGIGICYAICEKLLSTGAFVFFATHFLDMAQLALNYPKIVKNYHFASVSTIDPTTGLETLAPSPHLHDGPYEGPLYGLELAELATFPKKITQEARQLAERIRAAKETCVTSSFFEKSA